MSNNQEFSIFDSKYSQILALLWFRVKEDIAQHFEQFLFNQQWYRKWYGGKWNLLCSNKDVYWSPESNFADVMADLGAIVDVIKKEDWDVDKN